MVSPGVTRVGTVPSSLSASAARRVALAAQGFGGPPPAAVGTRQLGLLLARLAVLQIDSVNVFERSHYLPAFARLGAYDKRLLDRLTLARRAPYIEYWAHVAAFVHRDDWPIWGFRRDHWRARAAREGGWVREHPAMVDWVRDAIRADGPMTASEIEHEENVRRGPWWGWSDVKEAVEWLWLQGELVTSGRRGFERVYDLPERVLPASVLAPDLPAADAHRELCRRAVRALGVATAKDVADYHRLRVAEAKTALADLVDAGEAQRVPVDGWREPGYVPADLRVPRRMSTTALLSPFDPVVWERDRALRLFGFHYRIEIYTPESKRVFGYYSLPVLVDDALVGRIDLKSDRQAGVLRVQSAWREPQAPAGIEERVAPVLRSAAQWQGLEQVAVTGRGDLAADLAGALGVRAGASAD